MRKATHVCSMEAGASLDHDPWSRLGNSKYHLCKASMSPGRAQALSNQKYSELAREFGPTEVCLLTGDTARGNDAHLARLQQLLGWPTCPATKLRPQDMHPVLPNSDYASATSSRS